MTVPIPAGAPKPPTELGRSEMLESAATFRLVAPTAADHERWRHLYSQFAEHYTVPVRVEHQDLVWSWIMDPDHPLQCLLAVDADGVAQGLAHYRAFTRPLAGSVGCFLDDLLVDTEARGSGVADALLHGLRQIAFDNGWTVVRWITADDNHRARGVYDEFAVRTMWVTYDMTPGELPDGLKEVLA
jgi:GNAT superfamily N-acetyltransferase